MAFLWRVDNGPILVIFGTSLSTLKLEKAKKKIVKVESPLTKHSISAPEYASLTIGTHTFKGVHPCAQMSISCIKCVLEEILKTHSQNSQRTQLLRYSKYLSQIKLITKNFAYNLVLLWKL